MVLATLGSCQDHCIWPFQSVIFFINIVSVLELLGYSPQVMSPTLGDINEEFQNMKNKNK